MKSKLRLLVILGTVLFFGRQAMAQVSEKGTPAGFAFKNAIELRSSVEPFKTPIQFNIAELKAEDKIAEENNTPLRTAIIIPVELDSKKDGEWITLPNGQQIWRLSIQAPEAIAIMLYYDEFIIPEGGKLFIYNEDQSHIIGAYTSKSNPTDGAFATEFVAGDNITLEYNAPYTGFIPNSDVPLLMSRPVIPDIKISGVGYGYNYLRISRTQNILKIGESDACEVNINCPEGDNWQDQKKGVAKTVTPIGSGSYLCSGTLVNNTAQDMTPFFLTASHCIWDASYTNTVSATGMNQIIYYFHYESPTCVTTFPTAQRTIVGAQLLIDLPMSGSSDGVLYRLNGSIPLDWDLYFNGWDRRNIAATSGVGIHHPSGDVKKISTFTGPVTSYTWNNTIGAPDAHWSLIFSSTVSGHGVTEGGSSGSPMFNQNGLVVGTLTGGNSNCDNLNGINAYGKLWYHWDHVTSSNPNVVDNTKKMSDYLDPLNTGQETLNGTYSVNNLPTAEFAASSTNIYALESIVYTDYSINATSWQWTFQGGTPATYTGQTPPPIRYNSVGSYQTTLTINGGAGLQETKTENITVTLKGTPATPVADFAVPDIVYNEGFDAGATWASDWTVDNKPGHVSPNSWTRGNLTTNFNAIDPSSTASACINWNAGISDTWLITNTSFPIDQGSSIEFYTLYDGAWLNHAHMNFLVSADNGTTWTQLWTTGTVVTSRVMSWSRNTIDLSGYAGQGLMFAWQYDGADGNSMAVDGIKLFGPVSSVTINVGDYLTPLDFSTGTPVLWDWTFNGATPANATDEAPSVQYMTVGTYDISLTVTNTAGTDTKTLSNAVTVIDRTPVTDFKAESPGYTMRDNFGPFITPNHSVDFIDLSTNYPTSWSWTFTGGSPTSSTVQNPSGITYNAPGGQFDVTLVTDNTVSTPQTKTIPGFVKAMYNDPTRIWNLEYGENVTTYTIGGTGIFGSSSRYSMCSERFDAPMAGGYISAVDIKCFKTNVAATGNITVAIYTDNNGRPGTIIGSAATIPFDNTWPTNLAGASYYTATFATPILVSDAFHIRISGIANSAGVVIPCAANRGDLQKNTSLVYESGEWGQTSKLISLNTSMDVVPYFEYTSLIQAGFEAEYKGYIREANYGRFIPTDVTLDFFDRSVGIPVDWNWTFSGGTPSSSIDANPLQISYNTSGNHAVKLEVTNSAGVSDDLEIFDYVRAAYDVDDRIWNMRPGELGDQLYGASPNYVTGKNTYGDIAYAERFDEPLVSGYIYGVDLMLESMGGSGTLEVSICKDENGLPGQTLTSETLNVGSIISGGYTRVMFTNDAYTDGAFFVVVSGFDVLSGSVAIRSSNILPSSAKNTAYVLDAGNDWWSLLETYLLDNSLSLNMAPLFTYHIPTFSVDGVSSRFLPGDLSVTRKNVDLAEDTVSVISSIPWTATSTASWVTINNGSAAGDDEFWFSVTDNTTPYPRIAKIIVAPTGLDKLQQVILIRQASTYPAGLTAAFDSNGDVQVDWTAMPLNAPAPVRPTPVEVSLRSSTDKKRDLGDLIAKNGAEAITPGGKVAQEKAFAPSITRSSLKAAPAETVIRWDNGINYNALGISSGQNYKLEAATLFTAADMSTQLLPSGISRIKEVEVYINDLPVNGIVLKIRQGNIVYRQEVFNIYLMPNSYNTIFLNEPFVLDGVSDTYISYEFYCNGGMYVAGIAAGPGIAGKGDLISEQDGPFYSLTAAGLPCNWNIAAKIETGRVDYYVLYRDGVELTRTILPTASPSYLDTDNLSFGNHCYGIAALFDDLESTPSPDACVFQLSPENSLFTVSPSSLQFAAAGDNQDITITINDPSGYISTYSLNFYNDRPGWLTGPSIVGNTYTYTAAANTTGSALTGDIHIWLSASGSSTYTTSNGYAIPVTQFTPLSAGMFDYDLSNRTYNGAAQTVSVALNAAYTGLGAITVLYDGLSTAPVNAGTYAVSINALAGANFGAVTGLVLGSLTIDPAPLTIRPNDVSRPFGAANPTFTAEFTTLLGSDTPASIVGLTMTTTATTSSAPGIYPITASGGANPNYTITYVDGELTVETMDQTIFFPPIPSLYVGDEFYVIATSSVGIAISYTSSDAVIAEVGLNTGKITAKAVGTVTITASNNGNLMYSAASASCTFTITERPTDPIRPPDDPETGSEYVNASQTITVYPNPVSKYTPVYVNADVDEALLVGAVITVYTESGSLVKNVQVTGKLTRVDLSVDSGTYLFVLKGKDGIIKTLKIIVK